MRVLLGGFRIRIVGGLELVAGILFTCSPVSFHGIAKKHFTNLAGEILSSSRSADGRTSHLKAIASCLRGVRESHPVASLARCLGPTAQDPGMTVNCLPLSQSPESESPFNSGLPSGDRLESDWRSQRPCASRNVRYQVIYHRPLLCTLWRLFRP